MILAERDIEIDFTDAIDAIVFDQMEKGQPNYHGIGEMHRVDFIVEFESAIIFIEIKDPCDPNARTKDVAKFKKKIMDGKLCDSFACKFVDSFFYRWAEDRLSKTIHYLSLLTLEAEILPNFSDEVAKLIPPYGKKADRWQRHPIKNCQAFNIETWNDSFPKWPVSRISDRQVHIGGQNGNV